MTIGVLLVDDSAVVRGLITRALSADSNIRILGSAFNGAVAIPLVKQYQPDIIILDIEMPEMDGITALPKLIEAAPKAKIIMASTLTLRNADISLRALELGASDYVAKPTARDGTELEKFYRELLEKIYALTGHTKLQAIASPSAAAQISPALFSSKPITLLPNTPFTRPIRAVAIACSTGGPQALVTLFTALRGHLKNIPIFITQHMPPTFTTILAQNISKVGERPCKEGMDGELVAAGQTYIAPGNFHMVAERKNNSVVIHTNQEPPENFCRPAADPMLRSLSAVYGAELLVVVMTGMGSDGLEGAKIAVSNAASVVAQDEASSVVWGMPGAVATNGLCRAVLPLKEIAPYLIRTIANA